MAVKARTLVGGLVGVVLLALGLTQLLHGLHEVGVGQPHDASLESRSAAATQAAQKFLGVVKSIQASGQPPRQTSPVAGPLLDQVFDVRTVVDGPTPSFSEVGAVTDWLKAVTEVGQVYITAGVGPTASGTLTQGQAEKIGANLVAFAPEVGRYLDAALGLTKVTAAMTADKFGNAQPSDQQASQGLDQVRGGIAQTLGGAISMLGGGPDDTWRAARTPALVAAAAPAHRLLTADQQKALKAQALQAAGSASDPKVKQGLTDFASAIAG